MLKILCHIRTSYPPRALSGADIMCERINTFMAAKGCEVIAVVDMNIQPYEWKGVQVMTSNHRLGEKYEWADVIITHLINKSESTALAARFNKPIFHVCHNDNTSTLQSGTPNNYVIYNSEHLRRASPVQLPGIVVNPPTWVQDWKFTQHHDNQWHLLVNCVANKGGEMLYQLATEFPLMQFRGVKGGYGQQIIRSTPSNNLHYREHTADMRSVYDQTRVVIIPSIKESWSFVGAEAQACGIPVVCSDLPGLRENLGDAAIYCNNKREFMEAISKLKEEETYTQFAAAGRINQENKNYRAQLDNLFNFMCMKAGKEQLQEQPKEKAVVEQAKEKHIIAPTKEKQRKNNNGTNVK